MLVQSKTVAGSRRRIQSHRTLETSNMALADSCYTAPCWCRLCTHQRHWDSRSRWIACRASKTHNRNKSRFIERSLHQNRVPNKCCSRYPHSIPQMDPNTSRRCSLFGWQYPVVQVLHKNIIIILCGSHCLVQNPSSLHNSPGRHWFFRIPVSMSDTIPLPAAGSHHFPPFWSSPISSSQWVFVF